MTIRPKEMHNRVLLCLLFFLGCAVNIKRMVGRAEIVKFAGRLDNFIDPRIAKFYDLARVHIDKVIVLHAVVGFFKLRDIFAELMFDHKVAVEQ